MSCTRIKNLDPGHPNQSQLSLVKPLTITKRPRHYDLHNPHLERQSVNLICQSINNYTLNSCFQLFVSKYACLKKHFLGRNVLLYNSGEIAEAKLMPKIFWGQIAGGQIEVESTTILAFTFVSTVYDLFNTTLRHSHITQNPTQSQSHSLI